MALPRLTDPHFISDASGPFSAGLKGSVLTRLGRDGFSRSSPLSPLQSQVDGLVSHFVEEAAKPRTLAAITAGSLAYRFVRAGVMGLGQAHVAGSLLRPLSVGVGLTGEVTAFELTNRTLATLTVRAGLKPAPTNLWNWSGPGGWREGMASSFITFGMLKGAGHLSRESNLILQHSFSSTAMVAGHQTASLLGIMPRPEGSLAEQLLHAEATNLQLGAGMALMHSMAPGVAAMERGLDLSLQSKNVGVGLVSTPWEGRTQGPPLQPLLSLGVGVGFKPARTREQNLHILQMSSTGGEDGKGPPAPPSSDPDRAPTRRIEGKADATRDEAQTVMDLPPETQGPPPLIRAFRDVLPDVSESIGPLPPPRVSEPSSEGGERPLAETKYSVLAQVERIPPAETGLEAGGVLAGRYQILDYLGSGGFGHVIKVKDLSLERFAVIKVPRSERNTEDALARFSNEIRITANLDSRHVVTVYDLIRLADGRVVPVMEFVPGNDLYDIIHQLPLSEHLQIFTRICEKVDSAHRRGIIHRDLKPANIRITPDGDVRIMDWGLAKGFAELKSETREEVSPDLLKVLEQGLTAAGTFGSPGYIAPELFRKQYQGNPRTIDVFALGVILYEMITGRHPFTHGKYTAAEKFHSTDPMLLEPPLPFRQVIPEEFPSSLYEKIQQVVNSALDPQPEGRFESAMKLREALLMVWAGAKFDQIVNLRRERGELEKNMIEAWSHYQVNRQVTPELEEQMEGALYDLIERKGEIDQSIESLVLDLTRLTNTDPAPEARKMIAELSWMRLTDGADLLPTKVRQGLMDRIREFDTSTNQEPQTSMKEALKGQVRLSIQARDFRTGQGQDAVLHLKIIPIEEYRPGYFREAAPILEGPWGEIQDQLKLGRGYYVVEASAPGYAFIRVPLSVTWTQVRRGILEPNEPFRLNLNLIPQKEVPRGFFVVHEGEGVVGLNIHRFEDPSLVISYPERKMTFPSFAVSNPISVDQYRIFIEDQLKEINTFIQEGRFREAAKKVEDVRGLLPRDQPRMVRRPLDQGQNWETFLANAFEGARFHWRITREGEAGGHQFSLINPTTHRSLRNDPILSNQPISGISYVAAEAYTRWRSVQDGRDYKIISADQKEIISRNSFAWTYPWGYRFRRTYLASRLVHKDLENETFAHPIGTHPLGEEYYRDFSIYGGRDRQGRLIRLVDLLGNVREWTSTEAEERAVFMFGGSVRTPSGTFFLPSSRSYYAKDLADEYHGGFRIVIEFGKNQ